MVDMLNKGVTAFIPEKGSLGASGDLAPLSHMVLPMLGLGMAYYEGELLPGAEAMKRAGIPTIDEAWKKANHPEKANTAEGLREIVRRERQIEFYLENQRFWDLRRWKDAGILGEKVWGMNIEGDTDETFFVPTELQNIRTFKQAQYLLSLIHI